MSTSLASEAGGLYYGYKPPSQPADHGEVSVLPLDMPLVVATAADGPLSPAHVRELAESRTRAKKVRRAAAVAAIDGWTTGVFGAVALIGGIWSVPALALGLGLVFAAVNGLHARRALLRFEPKAAPRLALNQLIVAVFVAAYCAWNIQLSLSGRATAGTITATGDPNVDALMAGVEDLARNISVMVYSAVIVLTALVQGLTGLYYMTRRRYVEAYLRETPQWIVRLHARDTLD